MDDLREALRGALDETVGATAKRREAEEKLKREMAAKRDAAIRSLASGWRSERNAASARVERSVRELASAASDSMRERLSRDERMPVAINHLERYAAMKAIQDRNRLLARIEQTIDLAEIALGRSESLDPQAAISEAAAMFREALQRASAIAVAPVEEGLEADGAPPQSEDRASLLASFEEDASAAFDDALRFLGDFGDGAQSEEDRLSAFGESLRAAKERAESAHRNRLRANAQAAAGKAVGLDGLPVFDGTVECVCVLEPVQVAELIAAVRESFATYCRVVRDNGVFSAFSEGSSFGRCVGRLSWYSAWDDWSAEEFGYDDSEYLGDAGFREFVRSRIPTEIEDVEEKGDSLPTAISRMRELNKRKYCGMLDDDFKQHVDAFWYGFGKLMEAVNGMFEVDLSEYVRYCRKLTDAGAARCGDLAVLMDGGQVEAYCDDLAALRDEIRKHGTECVLGDPEKG